MAEELIFAAVMKSIVKQSHDFTKWPRICRSKSKPRLSSGSKTLPRKKSLKPLSIKQAREKLLQGVEELLAGNAPGVISLQIKRPNGSKQTYPLRLTQQQRESLIHCTRIKNNVKVRFRKAGEGTQTVLVTLNELDHLNDELGQASVYALHPDKKRLVAVHRKVAELFASELKGLFEEDSPATRKTVPTNGIVIYQFKITLLEIKPAVWRRIQVPDCSLDVFHDYIQAAFGWWDDHLHQFLIDGERIGPHHPDAFGAWDEVLDESTFRLSKLIPKSGRSSRWIYEYDFGDRWRHEIVFEGFPPTDAKTKFPLCLEGERACPPEEIGGPWGYTDGLAALRDPKHERHDEMVEWLSEFDPEAFDAEKATNEMRKVRSKGR